MELVREFRDSSRVNILKEKLEGFAFKNKVKIMEVCGTHTMQIHRFGIHQMLPENVKLISGPGCPVCVTENSYIDHAIELARAGFTITTFGDMIRVPGSYSSLEKVRAEGGDVHVVYSPMDSLELAQRSGKEVIFLAIGFETTAPTIGATVQKAKELELENFSILAGNKLVPPALKVLVEDRNLGVNGFLLPGHVSVIIGMRPYEFITEYGVPGVISGFEPVDIISSIVLLLEMIEKGEARIINNYKRAVRDGGNPTAQRIIQEVFEPVDSEWRGLGWMEGSGLGLREEYSEFDAEKRFQVDVPPPREHPGCRCGDVLKGIINPPECPLFGKVCTPENPVGPCMVSSEGSCSAWYKYG